MIKQLTISERSNFFKNDSDLIISDTLFKSPINMHYIENIESEDTQPFLLSEFMNSKEDSNQSKINEYMLKIFIQKEPIIPDISGENDQIYLIQPHHENKINTESLTCNKISKSIQTKKENSNNLFITQNLLPSKLDSLITLPKKNYQTYQGDKVEFIAKKRKSPEKESETNKDFPILSKNSETKESNEDFEISNYKYQYRLDYYKKAFKVHCFKHLTKTLNFLVSKCNFPKELKLKKICKPNNESFTSNAKEKDNYEFLSMPLKDIYSFVKNSNKEKGIGLQQNNKIVIDKMLRFIKENKNKENKDYLNLEKYLNMNMEEYINIYYESEEFKNFCKDEKIQFYEKEFIKEKKFPILKDYGFLKLIKMFESNKSFSDGLKSIHSSMNGINAV